MVGCGHYRAHEIPEAMEVAEEGIVDLCQEEPNPIHVAHCEDSEIQETQMYDTYNGLDGIRTNMTEECKPKVVAHIWSYT